MLKKLLGKVNPKRLTDEEILVALAGWGCTLNHVKGNGKNEVVLSGVRMYVYDAAIPVSQLKRLEGRGLISALHDTGNVVRYEASVDGLGVVGSPEDGYRG